MKRMACKDSRWKPANQSKDRRIRKGKKAILFQAWRGLKSSRRLRLPDFKRVGTRRL